MVSPSIVLAPHQRTLQAFRDDVLAELDQAALGAANDSQLQMPHFRANLHACKWRTTLPKFPAEIAAVVPFQPNEIVTIKVRYEFGPTLARINVTITPEDDGPYCLFRLDLSVDPRTNTVIHDSGKNVMGSDKLGMIRATESNTRMVLDAIFAHNDQYLVRTAHLNIVSALRHGIVTQSDLGAEEYTAEEAAKFFGTSTLFFQASARAIDRTHPQGKSSRLNLAIIRTFTHDDYTPIGLFDGMIEQSLDLVTDPSGRITEITRCSILRLCDEPAIVPDNEVTNGASEAQPRTMLAMMYNEVEGDDIPEGLRSLVYPDENPTLDDLAYFLRIMTKPVCTEDTFI